MHLTSREFSNTTSLMTSVCMLYVGAMAASSYLSQYADKLLKGENKSIPNHTFHTDQQYQLWSSNLDIDNFIKYRHSSNSYIKEKQAWFIQVRKKARIRNRYNQVPHLTQNTTWESDKTHVAARVFIQIVIERSVSKQWRNSLIRIRVVWCLIWTCTGSIYSTKWRLDFFCGSFLFFMFRVCHAFLSVHCSLVVTCWKGLATWLSCMLCFIVFFSLSHVMSLVMYVTWLYRFLIFASLSTFLCVITILGNSNTRSNSGLRNCIWT